MMPKKISFLSSFVILSILISTVLGSVFTYLPSYVSISASNPDVIYHQSTSSGISSILGPNRTYANITVKASTAPFEVTTNGDYSSGPAPWTFISGNNITSAYWYPTLYGRNGVILMNGSVNAFSDGAGLVQMITWPSTTLSSASLNISYRIIRTGTVLLGWFYIGYSIRDLAFNIITQGTIDIFFGSGDSLWNTQIINLNAGLLNPGANYYLVIEVGVIGLIVPSPVKVEYVLDHSIITATPSKPYFLGPVLHLNTSISSYNVSLTVTSINPSGNTNVSIWLRNHTASVDSSKIVIQNSALINGQTNEIIIAPVGVGYYGMDLMVDTQIDPTAKITLELTLKYRLYDNVYVEYQITLTVIDPTYRDSNTAQPPSNKPIPLAPFSGG